MALASLDFQSYTGIPLQEVRMKRSTIRTSQKPWPAVSIPENLQLAAQEFCRRASGKACEEH